MQEVEPGFVDQSHCSLQTGAHSVPQVPCIINFLFVTKDDRQSTVCGTLLTCSPSHHRVVLCCVVLCCVVLCCAVLCCVVLCCVVLCCAVLCCVVVLCCAVLCCVVFSS